VVSDAGAAPERWSPLHPMTARRRRTPAVEGWSPSVIDRTLSVFRAASGGARSIIAFPVLVLGDAGHALW
jgi:hypothetical protein